MKRFCKDSMLIIITQSLYQENVAAGLKDFLVVDFRGYVHEASKVFSYYFDEAIFTKKEWITFRSDVHEMQFMIRFGHFADKIKSRPC